MDEIKAWQAVAGCALPDRLHSRQSSATTVRCGSKLSIWHWALTSILAPTSNGVLIPLAPDQTATYSVFRQAFPVSAVLRPGHATPLRSVQNAMHDRDNPKTSQQSSTRLSPPCACRLRIKHASFLPHSGTQLVSLSHPVVSKILCVRSHG